MQPKSSQIIDVMTDEIPLKYCYVDTIKTHDFAEESFS